ncbi:hypothetical protein JXB12_07495 [candidate division KSB1 bacterium]|nr:hypothetical protein [candidate division KSB1 bacterium]
MKFFLKAYGFIGVLLISNCLSAQIPNEGFFLGGGASMLLMNGTGKIEDTDFDVTTKMFGNDDDEDDVKIGWGWDNKILLGLSPYIGYRINSHFSMMATYNYYFEKNEKETATIPGLPFVDVMGNTMEMQSEISGSTDYSQRSFSLFANYFPSKKQGIFISAGLEFLSLSLKMSSTYDITGGMSEFYSATDTYQGEDNVIAPVLGAGIEIPIISNKTMLVAKGLYSFAAYKGHKLLQNDNAPLNPLTGEVEDIDLKLGIGGFVGSIGMQMYLNPERQPETERQETEIKGKKRSNICFVPNLGIAKAIGEGSEDWSIGLSAGCNIFFQTNKSVSLGGRIAYNRFSPNGEELIKQARSMRIPPYYESYDYQLKSTSGSLSIIELLPSIRFRMSRSETQDFNVALQAGAGFFFMSGDAEVKGYYKDQHTESSITLKIERDSVTKPGIQLGVAMDIKQKVTIQPNYNIILTEDENTKYFSLYIGLLLGDNLNK